MSSLTLRKATREKTKMRVALAGPSGSGKTYSALLLASGMTSWDKIALIDTENGSGDLYSHLGEYSVITLTAPFKPERYIEAIEECEKAGMEVIIIDSISHEWEGKGGILEIHDSMTGNSYTNWAQVTPRHNAFVQRILQSKCHVVATMRSKQDYVLTEVKGKQVPQKVGLKAITREGVDYEFTLVFDLNINHLATASKDRTGIFMNPAHDVIIPEKIGRETGQKILAWTLLGGDPLAAAQPPASSPAQQERILTLARELQMEVQKDICAPAKLLWPMTAQQADAVITRLEQKKKEQVAKSEAEMAEPEQKGKQQESVVVATDAPVTTTPGAFATSSTYTEPASVFESIMSKKAA